VIWLLIGVGGGLGAMARHALNGWVQNWSPGSAFPTGILTVNIAGSLVIGLLAGGLASSRLDLSNDMRTFLVVGVLGGFTTFSSFSLDTLTLVRGGHLLLAAWNVGGHMVVGLLAVALGYRLGSTL
jgi:CrcB protein